MPTAFITGATGFLGGHLAKRLCNRGYQVRALVRPTSCCHTLESLPIELVQGDLSDRSRLYEWMRGCEVVFHAAADYRLWTRRPAEMYASNVKGTRNVLQAAGEAGVRRVVYTSTVGTVGLNGNHAPADETSFMRFDSRTGHYKRSKFLAEQEALAFAQRGLPVVIVNPSAPVGSHDWKPTPTGRIVLDFLNGRMPMYLDTGLNLVDIEDVAEGHLLAAQRGRVGERYILGNENLSLRDILLLLAEITGLPAPRIRCPYPVALAAAWISEGLTWISGGVEPRVPREGVYMARKHMFFDSRKAVQELGFRPVGARVALSKAVAWFVENNYVTRPLPLNMPVIETALPLESAAIMTVEESALSVGK